MLNRRGMGVVCAAVGVVAVVLLAATGVTIGAVGPRVMQVGELADMALGQFHNQLYPFAFDHIVDDHGVRLGSLGSDIFHDPNDSYNEFWAVTDRGPNGNPSVRTFLTPKFNPLIMQVRVQGDQIKILRVLPILDQNGNPVTGLSNMPGFDEVPYDFNGATVIPGNPNGLDTEGIVRTRNGQFWLVDEYSPSLLHVGSDGRVIDRFVPVDSQLSSTLATTPNYIVKKSLPKILNARRQNRGFEGIAITPDETTLFIAMQDPLDYPTAALGRLSRFARMFRFDIASERITGEYVYPMDDVCGFLGQTPGCGVIQGEMKLSGLSATGATSFLVDERTDTAAKVYRVDVSGATNILGSVWDAVAALPTAATPALETLANPASQGITVLSKTLVVDLAPFGLPNKIEGISLVRGGVLAVANDNDFGLVDFATFDAGRKLSSDTKVKSRIYFIELP